MFLKDENYSNRNYNRIVQEKEETNRHKEAVRVEEKQKESSDENLLNHINKRRPIRNIKHAKGLICLLKIF